MCGGKAAREWQRRSRLLKSLAGGGRCGGRDGCGAGESGGSENEA
jgi:hypothetical protein